MEESGKILVELCFGTTCFVMGASKLQELESLIPPQYRKRVEIKAHTCLDLCKNATYMKAPFVKIDGEIISEATVEKVLKAIESKLNG
ncbi:MAG: NAD(P)H-dependent oxidoreductase subunit E [Candidatus Gastranaerophilaceae bacterium]|jgi:hydrogenase large subunit